MNEVEIVITGSDKSGPAFKSATANAEGLSKSMTKVSTVASGIISAGMLEKIGDKAREGFSKSIEAASSLGESMNAVDKIFGTSAGQIKSWGEQNATSFGLSQRAFNEMAVPLGASLKNAGIDMETVSGKTIDLTKRAADMASVFNTDVGDALEAIQAGLRGEADPLERYGVGLSAAAVEQRALADSGKATAKELTNQDKMMARIALIMDQTATSAGDFTDTQDGLANATRIANAQIEEAQAKLGQTFLPIMAKGAQVVGKVADAFRSLPEPIQTLVGGVAGLGAGFVFLGPKLQAAKDLLGDFGGVSEKVSGKIGALSKGIGIAAAAAIGLDVIGEWASDLGGKSKGVDEMTKSLKGFAQSGKFTGDLVDTWAGQFGDADQALGGFGLAMRQALDPTVIDSWGDPAEKLIGILPGFSTRAEQAAEKFSDMDAALASMVQSGNAGAAEDSFAQITKLAGQLHLPVDKLKELFPEYTKAVNASTESTDKLSVAQEMATKDSKEMAKALDDLTKPLFDLESAEEDYEQALDDATERAKENRKEHISGAKALDIHTEAGRKNREALREIAEKAGDVIVQMQNMNSPMGDVLDKAKEQRIAFINAATSMGLSETAAKKLADKYGLIPKKIETVITGDTTKATGALQGFLNKIKSTNPPPLKINADASRAYGVLNQLLAKINGSSGTVGVGVLKNAHGGVLAAYADGGNLSGLAAGVTTLVGEEGPEIVRLPFGSSIIPAGETSRIIQERGMASGGAVGGDRKSTRSGSNADIKEEHPKLPPPPKGYEYGPGGELYEIPPTKKQIGTAASVDIGTAVNVGPQIGYAVSVVTGPQDMTDRVLNPSAYVTGTLSNMPEASNAYNRGYSQSVASRPMSGYLRGLLGDATFSSSPGTSTSDTTHLTNSVSSSRGSVGRGGGGPTINVYVAGSILAEKQVVSIVRNEALKGGFRGLF